MVHTSTRSRLNCKSSVVSFLSMMNFGFSGSRYWPLRTRSKKMQHALSAKPSPAKNVQNKTSVSIGVSSLLLGKDQIGIRRTKGHHVVNQIPPLIRIEEVRV